MVIDEVIGISSRNTAAYTVPQDAVLNIRFYRTTDSTNYPSTITIHSAKYGTITDTQTAIEITGQVCKAGTQIQITNYCAAHITGFTVE